MPRPEYGWVVHLLERYRLDTELRGDGIYAVGRKTGPVKERYPGGSTHEREYLSPEVRLDAGKRTAHAQFEIQNDSQAVWRARKASASAITSSTRKPARSSRTARASSPRAT